MDSQTDAPHERQARIDRIKRLRDEGLAFEFEINVSRILQLMPAIIAKLETQLDADHCLLLTGLVDNLSLIMNMAFTCCEELQAENDRLINELGHLEETNYQMKREILHERFFYKESRRLFGDMTGVYGKMLDKARELLKYECASYAYSPESYELCQELASQRIGHFPEEQKKNDKRMQEIWRKNRWTNIEAIVMRYGELTGLPTKRTPTKEDYDDLQWRPRSFLEKEAAVVAIAKEFGFQSPGAAFQQLKRAGVKSLPDTWTDPF